jgi:hypothetical protein
LTRSRARAGPDRPIDRRVAPPTEGFRQAPTRRPGAVRRGSASDCRRRHAYRCTPPRPRLPPRRCASRAATWSTRRALRCGSPASTAQARSTRARRGWACSMGGATTDRSTRSRLRRQRRPSAAERELLVGHRRRKQPTPARRTRTRSAPKSTWRFRPYEASAAVKSNSGRHPRAARGDLRGSGLRPRRGAHIYEEVPTRLTLFARLDVQADESTVASSISTPAKSCHGEWRGARISCWPGCGIDALMRAVYEAGATGYRNGYELRASRRSSARRPERTKPRRATRSSGRRAMRRHEACRSGAGMLSNRLALSRVAVAQSRGCRRGWHWAAEFGRRPG